MFWKIMKIDSLYIIHISHNSQERRQQSVLFINLQQILYYTRQNVWNHDETNIINVWMIRSARCYFPNACGRLYFSKLFLSMFFGYLEWIIVCVSSQFNRYVIKRADPIRNCISINHSYEKLLYTIYYILLNNNNVFKYYSPFNTEMVSEVMYIARNNTSSS